MHRQWDVHAAIRELRKQKRREEFEAEISYLEALHLIAQGKLDEALRKCDQGLDACRKHGHGVTKNLLARLAFGVAVSRSAFDERRMERYFRIISRRLSPEEAERYQISNAPQPQIMRNLAADRSEAFWSSRTHFYPGVRLESGIADHKPLLKEYFEMIFRGTLEKEAPSWKSRRKKILKSRFRDVRGDTIFTLALKMKGHMEAAAEHFPELKTTPSKITGESILSAQKKGLLKLVEILDQKTLSDGDFKNQTPLLLAARFGDAELVRVLLDRHVDLDVQDTLGRVALHAAVQGGSPECFRMILKAGADPRLQTFAGRTPAVVAAQFGNVEILRIRLAETSYPVSEEEIKGVHQTASRFFHEYEEYSEPGRLPHKLGHRLDYQQIMEITRPKAEAL